MSRPLAPFANTDVGSEHGQRGIHGQRFYEFLSIFNDESYRFWVARDQGSGRRDMRDERDEIRVVLAEQVMLVSPCILLANVQESTETRQDLREENMWMKVDAIAWDMASRPKNGIERDVR